MMRRRKRSKTLLLQVRPRATYVRNSRLPLPPSTIYGVPAMKFRVVLPVMYLSFCGSLISGCGTDGPGPCTVTPFINPVTATLDHTAQGSANAVQFTTGLKYSGARCVQPAIAILYSWSVSDPSSASITSPGGLATCLAASSAPITVMSVNKTVNSSGAIVYIPTGLPSATLTCN